MLMLRSSFRQQGTPPGTVDHKGDTGTLAPTVIRYTHPGH